MPFSEIPFDILSCIALFSSLESIARLCQVCKRFAGYILEDKRLWVECLRRDVISNSIEFPKSNLCLEEASAQEVRFLVKIAVSMHGAYTTGGQHAKVQTFVVNEDLEVTWVKIVRGRWCLAAMSNVSESFINIWRIRSSGTLQWQNKFFLSGPVLDGVVDDRFEEIRIAVTVATTDPFIQILSLGQRGKPCLIPLKRLEGARHVMLLNDSLLGYATLCGDDTYPLLTDWRTGGTVRHSTRNLCSPWETYIPCRGNALWNDHIIVVLNRSLEIFVLPELVPSPYPAYQLGCQSLRFPLVGPSDESRRVESAIFYEGPANSMESMTTLQSDSRYSLRISAREASLLHRILNLTKWPEDAFSWDADASSSASISSCGTLDLRVGNSNGYELRLGYCRGGYTPVALELMQPRYSQTRTVNGQRCNKWRTITPACGLPSLEATSAMDFDDGTGVILLGSCRGEISVIQLVDISWLSQGDHHDDLPIVCDDSKELAKVPVPMDLSVCYHFSEMIHDRVVPTIVRDEAIKNWTKAYDYRGGDTPLGWSRDRRRHTSIHNSVLPFPRRRTLSVDQDFHVDETWNRLIRGSLDGRGDIVPIMYHKEHHDFVIFKIAHGIYVFNKGANCKDDEHRLRSLPYVEEDLLNPAVLEDIYTHRWRPGPLSGLCSSDELRGVNAAHMKLLEFLKSDDGRLELIKRSLSDDPQKWPAEDRKEIECIVRRRWKDSHKTMDDLNEFERHW